MITAFAGPKAADDFYYKINWRWGFGCFAIIFPVVAAPLFFVLKANLRKAAAQGVLPREKSGRTALESIWHYVVQFDGEYMSLSRSNRGKAFHGLLTSNSSWGCPILYWHHDLFPSV